jgi:hypothetical protein
MKEAFGRLWVENRPRVILVEIVGNYRAFLRGKLRSFYNALY